MFPIKSNFSSLHKHDLACSLCKDSSTTENEQHLLKCPILTSNDTLNEDMKNVKFEDIFSNEEQQEKVAKVFKQISQIYDSYKSK